MHSARSRRWRAVLATPTVVTLALVGSIAPASAVEADSYLGVIDITFPTDPSRVHYSDTYDAPRTGHVHKATDIMGPKLLPIYAAAAGTVTRIVTVDDAYGYRLTITDAEGRSYSYLHLNNDNPGTDDGQGRPDQAYAPGIALNASVERGQHIAYMGDSGNAEGTAPHLHFSITDPTITDPYGTHVRNPYASLRAAESEGDVPTAAASLPPAGDPPPSLPSPPDIAAACPAPTSQPTFTDVASGNVHLVAVECLAELAVTVGVGDGRYAPADLVTRLQMASFTARLLQAGGVTLPTDPPDAFDDDDGTVHELAVNQLVALDVIRGDTGEVGRTLYGTTSMKRDRMAAWMARAYELIAGQPLPATDEDYFGDDDPAFHEADINRLAAAGVVQGTGPGVYSPRNSVRRDQMASYLARTLAAATTAGEPSR